MIEKLTKSRLVAIQGGIASFHDLAARAYFKNKQIPLLPCQTFKQVCLAVYTGQADYGVIAIENSLAGSLLPNYGLIQYYHLQIMGEQYLPIRHNLMALPGQSLSKIRTVRSHPMALAQCSEFLEKHSAFQQIETADTAESAREIAEGRMLAVAAIASESAAKVFGLEILAYGIENLKDNYTRFFIVASSGQKFRKEDDSKASINFRIRHQVGSLLKVLQIFKDHQINLTLIQSIPIPDEPNQYSFHIDVEWDSVKDFEQAMEIIQEGIEEINVLGIYKKGNRTEIAGR